MDIVESISSKINKDINFLWGNDRYKNIENIKKFILRIPPTGYLLVHTYNPQVLEIFPILKKHSTSLLKKINNEWRVIKSWQYPTNYSPA